MPDQVTAADIKLEVERSARETDKQITGLRDELREGMATMRQEIRDGIELIEKKLPPIWSQVRANERGVKEAQTLKVPIGGACKVRDRLVSYGLGVFTVLAVTQPAVLTAGLTALAGVLTGTAKLIASWKAQP